MVSHPIYREPGLFTCVAPFVIMMDWVSKKDAEIVNCGGEMKYQHRSLLPTNTKLKELMSIFQMPENFKQSVIACSVSFLGTLHEMKKQELNVNKATKEIVFDLLKRMWWVYPLAALCSSFSANLR